MDSFSRFFIKFQGYSIGALCVLINFASFFDEVYLFHYPQLEFFDYRYMGKTTQLFDLIWIGVGVLTLYGVHMENYKFLYPFAILFTLDLFLLILRDIVVIWIDHPWARINLLWPESAFKIFYATVYVMSSLVALGKLFDGEISSKSRPNFVWFKRFKTNAVELLEEDCVELE